MQGLSCEVNNLTAGVRDFKWLKKAVLVFSKEAKIGNKFFSLALVDHRTIKKFNRLYRGKNRATDVLSFTADKDEAVVWPEEKNDLGEILICVPYARKQAKEFGWSVQNEISRLLVHGLAHLVGYEHEGVSKKRAEEMFEFERRVIKKIKF